MATTLLPAAYTPDDAPARDPALDLDPALIVLGPAKLLEVLPHLAKMMSREMPPDEALREIAEDVTGAPLRAVCLGIAERVAGGAPLDAAMRDYPRVFPEDVVSLVARGSASGGLIESVQDATAIIKERVELRDELISQAIHPLITLGLCVVIVIGLLKGVIPKMAPMLEMIPRDQLGTPTAALLAVSAVFDAHFGAVLFTIALATAALVAWVRTYEGRQTLVQASMRVTVVRKMAENVVLVTYLRSVARLLKANPNAPEALLRAAEGVTLAHLQPGYLEVARKVRDGAQVADALRESGLVPGRVRGYIKAGERAGVLSEGFEDGAADAAGTGAKYRARIKGLMPTLTIGVVACLVVPVILLLFGAMFKVSQGVGMH